MVDLVKLDEGHPAIGMGKVAVTLLHVLRVTPERLEHRMTRAGEVRLEPVTSLVEAASGRAVRINRVPTWNREDHEIFVVGISRGCPPERWVRVLAPDTDVEPARENPGAGTLAMHDGAVAMVDEGLSATAGVSPSGVRLNLA